MKGDFHVSRTHLLGVDRGSAPTFYFERLGRLISWSIFSHILEYVFIDAQIFDITLSNFTF